MPATWKYSIPRSSWSTTYFNNINCMISMCKQRNNNEIREKRPFKRWSNIEKKSKVVFLYTIFKTWKFKDWKLYPISGGSSTLNNWVSCRGTVRVRSWTISRLLLKTGLSVACLRLNSYNTKIYYWFILCMLITAQSCLPPAKFIKLLSLLVCFMRVNVSE